MCARASEPPRTDATALTVRAAPLVLAEPAALAPGRTDAAGIRPRATPPARSGSRITVRRIYGVGRIGLAATGVAALLGYFEYVLGFATFAIYNYFSYFTVLSGMAAIVAFVAAAIVAFRREVDPPWLDWFRLLITTYIIVSGVVFLTIVIQSSSRAYTIEVPWSSQLLHFWIPSIALLDWLTDAGKARLPWKTTAWVMLVPGIWGAFTLTRGALVGWYPYFFLDPAQVSGPLETVLYSLVAVALFTGIAAALTATTRLPRRVPRPPQG
ncbi:Pr6Pr family membrane protein [Cryobacterium sp. PH31-AA6]|uniref:Pr6Pr family membrane protein n=1 Tax=Cryobacterium sp. PH31-AA6 TaxID=3046205 RepID=UPI0024B93393|nr:Pr6Pr family membrane protein [Cryobacterium sp. PH31-AA6]MDJ0324548.1 Pr6Pr family membrane protein [Cryobacterium sp. PH31-AA6]